MSKILLVDDEALILESLTYSLQREGFDVHAVEAGAQVLPAVEQFKPDLVVLDIMLPDMGGLEVCRLLRANSVVPVIMLTARGEELDRILGLEAGADDYLAKPFSFRELLARIRAILRRVEIDRQTDIGSPIEIGQVALEPAARRLRKHGNELTVSAREFDLLTTLMKYAGQAMSREELIDKIWGKDWVGDVRTLDVHIHWLRLKIEDDPASPQYIQTVRGFGYRFVGPEEIG